MGNFITEAQLAAVREGSYEGVIEGVEVAASAALGRDVRAVATWADHAVVVDDAERFERVAFRKVAGQVTVQGHEPYAGIATLGEEAIPAYVAREVRALVQDVAEGRCAGDQSRMRMRSIAPLIEAGERYWLVDAAAELAAARDDAWHAWYAADVDQIRRKVWGSVREREARIPAVADGAAPQELRVAVEGLTTALAKILDEAHSVTFDKSVTDLDAIRCSLIGEAQAMVAALQSAGRLMLEDIAPRDVARMARAQAECAERARHMVIAVGYLAQAGRGTNERGDGR